jgi:phosphatidylglycerophosphate synthase
MKLNRVLSKPLTGLLLKTPVTPNQITCFNLILGILTAFFFSKGDYASSLVGAFLYQLLSVLDNCDGEIARAKNIKSEFGGWLDMWVDILNDLAFFFGLTWGLLANGTKGPVALAGALCVTGSVLHFLVVIFEKKKGFGPAVFSEPYAESWQKKNFFLKVFNALREGDASWFVVIFALAGQTEYLLWFGAIYMQALWLGSLAVNFKVLFAR